MRKSADWSIQGVDFTSRPRIRKPMHTAPLIIPQVRTVRSSW
jgi:hypothetical protein